jgi:hypothetical protein
MPLVGFEPTFPAGVWPQTYALDGVPTGTGRNIRKYKLYVLDGRIILRWIFRKWDVSVWTGSIWLRIGTGGGHL